MDTSTSSTSSTNSLDRDIRLIQAIRGYDVLYDPRCLGYKDPRVKENTWKIVASQMDSTPEDCRNRWRSLRDRFVREKKAMLLGQSQKRNLEDDGTQRARKTWRLLEPMSFLWDFIMHRSRRGIKEGTWTTTLSDEQLIKMENGSDDGLVMCEEDDENGESAYEWIAVSEEHEEEDLQPEPLVKQRKRHREARSPGLPVVTSATSLIAHEEVEVELHEEDSVIKRARVMDHEEHEDEDTLFCKSVAHTLRRLAPRRKALAKLRVLQALYDAEFGSDVGPDVEVRLKTADA